MIAVPIEAMPPAIVSRAPWMGRKAKPMPFWSSRTPGLEENAIIRSVAASSTM